MINSYSLMKIDMTVKSISITSSTDKVMKIRSMILQSEHEGTLEFKNITLSSAKQFEVGSLITVNFATQGKNAKTSQFIGFEHDEHIYAPSKKHMKLRKLLIAKEQRNTAMEILAVATIAVLLKQLITLSFNITISEPYGMLLITALMAAVALGLKWYEHQKIKKIIAQ